MRKGSIFRLRPVGSFPGFLVLWIIAQFIFMAISWVGFVATGRLGIDYLGRAKVFATRPYTKVMEVTAYTAGPESTGKYPGHPGYAVTASNHKINVGTGEKCIAAPPEIEFGTRIFVPGYGVGVVRDRGEAIRENCLDIYIDNVQEAKEWGRRWLEVIIFPVGTR